ncbi:MAG: hypothetical protein JZU65_23775 [Chlorobium sp.]|nr:hypothetical protein [Chlorobium sp.]
MKFSKIVPLIVKKKISKIEERDCHDQYVGKISGFHSDQNDFFVRTPADERPNGLSCLIIVLESPHIKEFQGDVGPAKGKTGSLIRKWISSVDVDLLEYSGYGLILVNAIQYQCSLGMPTKCFRDEVFRAAWNMGGDKEFITRLKMYYHSGDAVVNCCTKGNSTKNELRRMVQKAIAKANLGCVTLGRPHPSSWFSKQNRKSTWEP